jgi:hypothetical protein
MCFRKEVRAIALALSEHQDHRAFTPGSHQKLQVKPKNLLFQKVPL